MNKVKDFVYNISDLIVALIIVLGVFIVIHTSIENIMSYPSMCIDKFSSSDKANIRSSSSNIEIKGASNQTIKPLDSNNVASKNEKINNSSEKDVELFSIYINYGESLDSIATKFVSIGLFKTKDEFKTLINNLNASENIKAGNFILPADATHEEVVQKITGSSSL